MHLYEIGERVEKGLLIQREPYPHIEAPPESDRVFLLAKNLSEVASRVPRQDTRPLRLEYAETEVQTSGILLKRDPYGRRSRKKLSAIVRVHVAAGCGGTARLRANCFIEAPIKKGAEEIGRQYLPFPSAGVHPFCKKSYLDQVTTTGLEFVDVLMMLQPGAGFRIHRTGDLKDQEGVKASPQISVRWTGYTLVARHYDDRVPVLGALEELPLAVAAE